MSLLELMRQAGVVGCGGAGFPTDIKLQSQAEYLLLNGVECEPLLRTDRYMMTHKADEIILAIIAVGSQIGARKKIIGVKADYREEIASLESAIKKHNADISIHQLESFYPAGDEHVVVHELTGKTVPPGGIPLDVGAVVSNVGTMFAVYEAMNGKPFTHKYLTVTGEVHNPAIIHAPIGTSVEECIRLAGGAKNGRHFLINGGPLMGKPITLEQQKKAFIGKTTSGILVLPEDGYLSNSKTVSWKECQKRAAKSCIQCSYCTMLCPRYLLGHPLEPHKIMRLFASEGDVSNMPDSEVMRSAQLCSQCEVCSVYACPMGLRPSMVNESIKAELAKRGIRPQKRECVSSREERKWRKVPSKRIAARAGVLEYYGIAVQGMAEALPRQVSINLRQGAGLPSEAIVKIGERVHEGQLIARRPENALGSDLHASINGTVLDIKESILISGG